MCGFAGKVELTGRRPPPSRELLSAMIATLEHRGPDSFGLYRDDRAGLAHARLSIVDLTTGGQPLCDDAGEWWIVFNGELFNHRELRGTLQALGHTFRTASDTEVIVNAFREWGDDCFARFNGQWALALWNADERRLVLSRDDTGICPLFVRHHGDTVWFASEAKALLADPEVPRRIDPRGIDQAFMYWAPIAPITPFEGIEELPPGTTRTFAGGSVVDRVHWQPSFPPSVDEFTGSFDDAVEALRHELRAATALRVTSADVPVGAYLSGGLDSSLTARLGNEATGGRLQTFSIRFADAEFDEGVYQHALARLLDSEHHELTVARRDIAEVFPEVVRHAERPVLRTAPAPMFLLSRAVRAAGVKAVLTGEGADEFLAGYDLFREARIRAFWARRPDSEVRPLLFDRIYPYLRHDTLRARAMALSFWKVGLDEAATPGFSHGPRWRSAKALRRFYSADFAAATRPPAVEPLNRLPADFGRWHPLSQAQYLECTTLLGPYLLSAQGDRQLLANGVEGRFPFLDRSVIDLCNRMPASWKLRGLDEKHLLKRAAEGLVPQEIIARQKQPYRAPDAVCFADRAAAPYVDDVLGAAKVTEVGIFDPARVEALRLKIVASSADGRAAPSNADNMAFVGVLSTQLVALQLLGPPSPSFAGTVRFDVDATPSAGRTNGR